MLASGPNDYRIPQRACPANRYFPTSSGSFAILAAMRRAS